MSDKASDKLLSCPFCGGENIRVYDCGTPSEPCWVVECLHCKVSASDYWDEDGAITAWNTRKPMGRIVERLEAESNDSVMKYEKTLEEEYQGQADAFDIAIEIVKKEM
jgi:Lar family restriction alleviation protein